MATFLCMVFPELIWLLLPAGALPAPGLNSGGSRTWRHVTCKDNLEYPHGNICCLNCPAGTRMTSACSRAGEKGQCEECDYGTYTEHSNGLTQCFKCTQCRSDQEVVRPCTESQDTECRCKSGRFCVPDQACEVCKKCSGCETDEEMVRNCTSTANTECKTIPADSGSVSGNTWAIVLLSLLVLLALVMVTAMCAWRHCRAADSQRNLPDGHKAGQQYSGCLTEDRRNGETPNISCSTVILSRQLVRSKSSSGMEDERKVLCESLNSSASNSQHSLTGPPSYPASPPRASPMVPKQLRREDEQFPELVPVNGDDSLKNCFTFFEDIDVDYYKRFFRHVGIADNVIKSKEHLLYEDKIHELLNIWMEKEGREADLNDLLKGLLALNQRRTAETVKEKAIHSGQYGVRSSVE